MQRFSEKARQVLAAANTHATQMHHPSIEVSHLLLAMLDVNESAAQKLLIGMRLKPEAIRAHLAGLPADPAAVPELSPNIKRVIQFAVDASKRWRHSYIGTEHLLLALARHNAPITRQLLETANTDGDRIRQRVESMFEAGILTEQPRKSTRAPYEVTVDEVVEQMTAQVVARLAPDDWKALSNVRKQVTIAMRETVSPYNMMALRRRDPDQMLVRVLEALLKRAPTAPDPHFLEPKKSDDE